MTTGAGEPRRPPFWTSRSGRARVLVESADPGHRHDVEQALATAGYEVVSCGGPDLDHHALCPAVTGDRCPTAAHADVVVCDLDERDAHTRRIPEAVAAELHDGATLIIETTGGGDEATGDLADAVVVARSTDLTELLRHVRAAVDTAARRVPPERGRTRPDWMPPAGTPHPER